VSQPTAYAIPETTQIDIPAMTATDFDLMADAAARFLSQLAPDTPAPSPADIAHDTRILRDPDRAQLSHRADWHKCHTGSHWAI
jgi:hypothetical protein